MRGPLAFAKPCGGRAKNPRANKKSAGYPGAATRVADFCYERAGFLRGRRGFRKSKRAMHQKLPLRREFLLYHLHFHIHPGGKIEVCERLNDLLARIQDLHKALVHAELKLFARVLMHERGPVHGVVPDLRGQRNRTHNLRVVPFGGLNDLARRIVNQLVVVGLDPQPDLLWRFRFLLRHVI